MKLSGLLFGHTKYTIVTDNIENVINLLKGKCSINDIVLCDGCIKFSCCYYDTKNVDSILKSNGITEFNRSSFGFLHRLQKYRKRSGLLIGAATVTLLLIVSTLFVWEIRVEGNEKVRADEIIELLKTAGFCEGVLKNRVKKESIINNCLIKDDRISWMSINYEGTVAHVELKEARLVKKIEKRENVNLVASFNGIIHRVDALSGSALVNSGDAVTKGQMLVSAFVDKRTGGSSLRGARGFVWANTERSYRVCVPLMYYKKEYTENSKAWFCVSLLGKSIDMGFMNVDYKMSEYETNSGKIRLTNDTALPIKLKRTAFNEYTLEKKQRSEVEAKELAKNIAKERLGEDAVSYTLISTDECYKIDNDILIYDCVFHGLENIAKELTFDLGL